MTTETQPSPQDDRVARVIEALAAEGEAVTVRAVKARAGVGTKAAMEAVQAYKDAQPATQAPEMPDAVQRRAQGLWEAAYAAACEELAGDRAAWERRVSEAEQTLADLAADTEETEQQHQQALQEAQRGAETARTEAERLQQALDAAQAQIEAAETRAREAENRANVAEGVATGLRQALADARGE